MYEDEIEEMKKELGDGYPLSFYLNAYLSKIDSKYKGDELFGKILVTDKKDLGPGKTFSKADVYKGRLDPNLI